MGSSPYQPRKINIGKKKKKITDKMNNKPQEGYLAQGYKSGPPT
jgi:hypothetical protein